MKFETQVIPIVEQIEIVTRVIDDYKTLVAFFENDEDAELREGARQDLVKLIAVKYSLKRLRLQGGEPASISVPADQSHTEWPRGTKTMQILTALDPSGRVLSQGAEKVASYIADKVTNESI